MTDSHRMIAEVKYPDPFVQSIRYEDKDNEVPAPREKVGRGWGGKYNAQNPIPMELALEIRQAYSSEMAPSIQELMETYDVTKPMVENIINAYAAGRFGKLGKAYRYGQEPQAVQAPEPATEKNASWDMAQQKHQEYLRTVTATGLEEEEKATGTPVEEPQPPKTAHPYRSKVGWSKEKYEGYVRAMAEPTPDTRVKAALEALQPELYGYVKRENVAQLHKELSVWREAYAEYVSWLTHLEEKLREFSQPE